MLKETITYIDFNDVERTEDFYFNMTEAEIVETELGIDGGYVEMLQRIVAAKDQVALADTWKKFILNAYGKKSDDGKRFIKSKELSEEFAQTPAYSTLYMKLITSDEAAAAFVNGIIPAKKEAKPSVAPATN